MNRNRDITDYKDTVFSNLDFFKKNYYHSIIDSNLLKLDSILDNGILSKRLIEDNNLCDLYTHNKNDFDSKNGYDYVSLSKVCDDFSMNQMFESFSFHTLTSLSLILNRNLDIEYLDTNFDDEIFVKNSIDKSNIEGIIIPDILSKNEIKNTCFLTGDLSNYTKTYINNLLDNLEVYFNTKVDREKILRSLKEFYDILKNYEIPERWVESILKSQRKYYGLDIRDILAIEMNRLWQEKTKINNPLYIDIVKYINNNRLPIYEINKEKILKK